LPTVLVLAGLLLLTLPAGASDSPVDQHIAALSHPNWTTRQQAAAALGSAGDSRRAVLNALTGALSDDDSRVRRAAAIALGRIGPKASRSIPQLVERFVDREPAVIAAAASAVGEMGSRASRVTTDLEGLLQHADPRVQVAAAAAIGNIGSRASKSADDLSRQLSAGDPGVRAAAAEALGKLGEKSARFSSQLVQLLADGNAQVRDAASSALVRIGKPATSSLVRALGKGDPVFLQEVVDTLAELGPVAVPALIKSLHNAGQPVLVRRYSALALARIGAADDRVVPALLESLDDPQALVRGAAVDALAEVGPGATPALQRVIELSADQREPLAVRAAAITAMAAIGPASEQVRSSLVAAVADGNPRIYEAAVAALVTARNRGVAGGADDAAVAALRRTLQTGGPSEQAAAARQLGELGPVAVEAVTDLTAVLADPDRSVEVRRAAASALGLIGPRAEAAIPELIRSLEDPGEPLRDAALLALSRIGPQTQTIPALLQAMRSGDLATRAAAAERVRSFAQARKEGWIPLLKQSQAPVLRHWLARYEQLYGVSSDGLEEWLDQGREDPDYFDAFGGRAAVRESVQLDLIARPEQGVSAAATIPVDSLESVVVESHPFDEMLEETGAPVRRVPLAELTPPDRLFAWFRDVDALQRAVEGGAEQFLRFESTLGVKSVDYGALDRHLARLGIRDDTLEQLQATAAVRDLAVILPDLFLVDGTDVTVLANLGSAQVTQMVLELIGLQAPAGEDYATHTLADGGEIYWAIRDSVLCISTSAPELRAVLQLQAGRREKSLGQSDEFLYMQQQLGIESSTSAYFYLSDPFIRRLVSPEVKIAQLRRMRARGEMEMLAAGAMLYLSDGNRHVPSKENLVRLGYVPAYFLDRDYTLDDRLVVTSAQYGSIASPRPLSANPVTAVTDDERRAYAAFVANYSNYWRQFFDPIAIRIDELDGQTTEMTTFILPLPESGLYNRVRNALATNESGLRLKVPQMTPAPSLMFSLNLSDDMRLSLSDELTDLLVEYTSVNPEVFDSIGAGIHLAVRDSTPIVALGGGDVWGALDQEMLRLGGFEALLPFLLSIVTQPSTVLIELGDPERVRDYLLAAVTLRSQDGSTGQLHKLQDQEAWIYTLNIEDLFQVHLRLEIESGYLLVSNLPWSAQPQIDSVADTDLNGVMMRLDLDQIDRQLPALHTKIFTNYRAASVEGMGYLYPLLVTGVSSTVDEALEDHAGIFGFRPVHPSSGQWFWRDSYLVSSEFGTASYPVQPEYVPGQRDFGLFPSLSMLSVNMQLEDTGLRARLRWRRR
jgi:HEAT repeat protein